MLHQRYVNPFEGLASSVITSNVIDVRDAFDITLSWRTSAGTSSIHTYQVCNLPSHASAIDTTYNTAWSNVTAFGSVGLSNATTYEPPLGYRFVRILRQPITSTTYHIDMNLIDR